MVPTRGFQIGKSNSLGDFRSRKEERPGSGSWGRERKIELVWRGRRGEKFSPSEETPRAIAHL